MSWLGRLAGGGETRGIESPAVPITDESLGALFGGGRPSGSGVMVTPEKAMSVGAALRGTQIIAGSIGGLPLKVYPTGGSRDEVQVPAVNGHNDYQTNYERWETVVAHMVLWGNAYLWKVRDRRGMVERLIPIHPSRVIADVVNEKDLGGLFRRYVIDGKPFTRYEILHIPCMSLDGVKGIGPITATREMFGTTIAAELAAGKLFGQGLMLSGFLTTDQGLDEGKAKALKRRWRATLQGAEHAGDVGILDNGAKYESLAMPPDDAQFLETRKFQVTEIARLLGIPGWMMNDQEKSTSWGTGMEQQFSMFVTITLKPYMQRIEQRVTHEVLGAVGGRSTQFAEFKVEGLLRGDSKARAAFYNAGITGGWLVPNEPRKWENLDPVPWGDEPYLPHNTAAGDEPSDIDPDDAPAPEEDQ